MKKRLLYSSYFVCLVLGIIILPIVNVHGFGFIPDPDPPEDTISPTVSITSHSNGDTISGDFFVQASASDNVGIERVIFSLHSKELDIVYNSPYKTENLNIDIDFPYNDGYYTLKAIAMDEAGNYAVSQKNVYVVRVVKSAVLVGISDFSDSNINDLTYCDEDVTDWYNFLSSSSLNFDNLWIYGDGHEENYPRYDGDATEANVKLALENMVNIADATDIICFFAFSHGYQATYGASSPVSMLMWDCVAEYEYGLFTGYSTGLFHDSELASRLDGAVSENIFVFMDICHSGGFGDDLMAMSNSASVYCTTACDWDGVATVNSTAHNGDWTHYFLERAWINNFSSSSAVSLEDIFEYAHDNYPHAFNNDAQEFDGSTSSFYLA